MRTVITFFFFNCQLSKNYNFFFSKIFITKSDVWTILYISVNLLKFVFPKIDKWKNIGKNSKNHISGKTNFSILILIYNIVYTSLFVRKNWKKKMCQCRKKFFKKNTQWKKKFAKKTLFSPMCFVNWTIALKF